MDLAEKNSVVKEKLCDQFCKKLQKSAKRSWSTDASKILGRSKCSHLKNCRADLKSAKPT